MALYLITVFVLAVNVNRILPKGMRLCPEPRAAESTIVTSSWLDVTTAKTLRNPTFVIVIQAYGRLYPAFLLQR